MNFKFFLSVLFLLVVTVAFAQKSPPGINYQAVARDAKGQVLANKDISLRVRLFAGETGGKPAYAETHRIRTNELGLFSLVVGRGQLLAGDFQQAPWSSMNVWMELAIDETGGDDYSVINASQLMAVPYAFHAATAGELNPGAQEGGEEKTSAFWKVNGNELTIPGPHYIGTIDAKDFVFKTTSLERLRITAAGDINIGNSLSVGVDLNVGRDATIGRNLDVNNNANIDKDLTVAGIARFNNTTQSTTKDNGGVIIEGGVGIEKNVNIGGNTGIVGNLTVNANTTTNSLNVNNGANVSTKLTVDGLNMIDGADNSSTAYPLVVQGSNQGIWVNINTGRDNAKNFITFADNSGIQGRVEGQTNAELLASFEFIWYQVMEAMSVALAAAEAVACGLQADAFEVVVNTTDAVAELADWIQYDVNKTLKIGVAFESGSGDYAEWLERANPDDELRYGEIVGVKGGKISRNTLGVDHVMAISFSPIVLGNMPAKEKEANYEKVAFMGQIPVRVAGKVEIGDYILPSGNNDGIGIAVKPTAIRTGDFARIVGVAWEASSGENLINLVNVAVGINTNDVALRVAEQEQELALIKQQMNEIYALLGRPTPYEGLAVIAPAAVLPTAPAASANQATGLSVSEINSRLEAARPMLERALAQSIARLEAKGIQWRQHPEIVSMVENPVAYLQEMSAKGYLDLEKIQAPGK